MMKLVKFDQLFLVKSFEWMHDQEIRDLIDGPVVLTREMQQKWYEQILNDNTYAIWGIAWDGVKIGACGIKHIDFSNNVGEYWGYIGEKHYWNGKGHTLMNLVYQKAFELNLNKLYLVVLHTNLRALHLYQSEGFIIDKKDNDKIYMSKQL